MTSLVEDERNAARQRAAENEAREARRQFEALLNVGGFGTDEAIILTAAIIGRDG